MKTKQLIIAAFTCLAAITTKAQVTANPFFIYNNNPICSVEIHWRVTRLATSCPSQCSANNVVIPPSSSISITCTIPNGSLIEVVLIDMGGNAIIPNGYVDDIFNNGVCALPGPLADSGSLPAGSPCGTTWNMIYTGGNAVTIW